MAKEVIAHIKLQIPAGQANPAPPVGTALGPRGVNIMAFCKEFNAATQKQAGDILPVVITVFKDKSFTFITKSPPAAVLLKKAANIAAGSKEPNKIKVGKVTRKQVMDIVKTKAKDLNARNDDAAFRIIAGTARQMGLEIVDCSGTTLSGRELVNQFDAAHFEALGPWITGFEFGGSHYGGQYRVDTDFARSSFQP